MRRLILRTLEAGRWMAVLVSALPAIAAAQYCTPDQCDECDLNNCRISCCYDPPELWLVNTRCAPKCSNLDAGFERISVKRYDANCRRFVAESWDSLIAQEASMPTLIFAHGNTLQHDGAMNQCWDVYHRLRCCPGPKRLVFWSWPAQVVYKRPIIKPRELVMKNLRIKLVYAEYQGYYMAKLVERMSMTQRVTIGGHSYGGIMAATAAHYLGGGELRGLTLAGGQPVERANFRLAIVSGAFDNDAMCPGCRYGQSFVAAEKAYVTRNRYDSTLQRWPEISYRCRKAIGVTGIDANCLGEHAHKLCQQTLSSDVGESHYIEPHLASARFMSALCCIAFPAGRDAATGATSPGGQPSRGPGRSTPAPTSPVDILRDVVPIPGRAWQRGGILN
ncbi:MAG: hypothetical protein DCC67_12565 [Planctomycetota bacterium]|nr:MAG: hypothetical protein DCC67_12565 [Planctomycetota bacterium]